MSKPLFDKDENGKAGAAATLQQPAKGVALPTKTAGFGAYSPAATPEPDLSLEAWRKSRMAWRDTMAGRGAIRVFSRGILGAAFFAWGGQYATRAKGLEGYHPYEGGMNPKKPLHIIARTIDVVAGKPIKWAVKAITGDEHLSERAIHFRPMTVQYSGIFKDATTAGRSLGEESVGITFDFFCASIGDALGRDLADLADKNVKKPWRDDEGHIDAGKAAKGLGKTLWRYFTYNGGEDWAVAVPYAYFMRGQRRLFNKFSHGFRMDATESNNGASFKVDEHANIIGDYNAVGALDLQSRFTVYNIGTLMYREAYDWAAHRLKGENIYLYGAPDKERHDGIIDSAINTAKWAARCVVKGTITMTPAVPFFWITRVPQGKYKGTFINPETNAMLGFADGTHADGTARHVLLKPLHQIRSQELRSAFTPETEVIFRKFVNKTDQRAKRGWRTIGFIPGDNRLNPMRHGEFRPQDYAHCKTTFSKILHPFGVANETVRLLARDAFKEYLDPKHISRFVNASISYTPYMFMKAETARAWDTGKMDMSAERMIDGAFSFNGKEFKEGAKEVWRTILHKPLENAEREAEGQRRINIDTSAGDSSLLSAAEELQDFKEAAQDKVVRTERKKAAAVALLQSDGLSWQERAVLGRATPEKRDMYSTAMAPLNVPKAEQEKMRKFLSEAVPPSNSKH